VECGNSGHRHSIVLICLHTFPALDTRKSAHYVFAMQLREHPLMRHRGSPSWPPVWTQVTEKGTKTVKGEVGVLRYVHGRPAISNKCFLVIEQQQERYVGCLIFDDLAFCAQITEVLKGHYGRAIKDIGDLDVSQTL